MKINIFYHIFLSDKIDLIVNEQVNQLINSNILENSNLYVVVLNTNTTHKLNVINMNLLNKYSTEIYYEFGNYYENITHVKLYEHSKNNDNGVYLYMHTKGITRINDLDGYRNSWLNYKNLYSYKNIENWRHIMEHFTIDHWGLCVRELETHDLVGCNYMEKNHIPGVTAHYSGTFWWATSDFIKKLDNPTKHLNNRMAAEFWIGTINHKALCLFPLPEKQELHHRGYVYTPKEDYYNNIIKNEFTN